MNHPAPRLILAMVLLAAFVTPALAAWPNQPTVNLPVCTSPLGQDIPTIVSDGAGGAIVVWQDLRGGATFDIYAQHVLASGTADPAWPANGRALCTAVSNQTLAMAVSDGAGGAIVTWQDSRNGASDIFAQHVLASGAVDPAWPVNGRALCSASNEQSNPSLVSDGAGGAIVTWQDLRGALTYDIYAQRVLASGAVDPAWPLDGRALSTAALSQQSAKIVGDGAGGAIVTWQDFRGGATYDIYAQHVLASGTVDSGWPANGRDLCTATGAQTVPTIADDGAGGAIVTWYDFRSGTSYDIYAQHVSAVGVVDQSWPVDGRAVCTAGFDQFAQTIASDGNGGAIVTWQDLRNFNYDVYAQHVLSSGTVDPVWPANGRALCTAAGNQQTPVIVGDGAGGAMVTWQDIRGGSTWDIYAQHVLASGAVDPAWPLDGRAMSTASTDQRLPAIVSDGTGGAIVAWSDNRNATGDIYCQRVARFGYLGTPGAEMAGVKDVPNDNGGKVKVSWIASYLDLAQDANLAAYDVYRSVPPNIAASARATGTVRAIQEGDMVPLLRSGLVAFPSASQDYAWEFVATVNPNHFASQYSVLAPTAFDSLGAGNPKTAFLVLARNASGSMFWPSRPDSGYSVDNLPPAAPAPFTANYVTGITYLHWNPNAEADLAGYRLYRGTSVAFTPSLATLVAALPDTGYADATGSPNVYKLTAVDAHGNESPVVTIIPSGTLGVGDGAIVRELALAPASPNPASRGTTLRFALPAGTRVSLAIFDAAGRLVRTLADGAQPAGEHAASWDLRDATGRTVRTGLYFARLEVAGRMLTRRIAVTR